MFAILDELDARKLPGLSDIKVGGITHSFSVDNLERGAEGMCLQLHACSRCAETTNPPAANQGEVHIREEKASTGEWKKIMGLLHSNTQQQA